MFCVFLEKKRSLRVSLMAIIFFLKKIGYYFMKARTSPVDDSFRRFLHQAMFLIIECVCIKQEYFRKRSKIEEYLLHQNCRSCRPSSFESNEKRARAPNQTQKSKVRSH